MGKPYPLAFRKRIVAAVESGGLSCNPAGRQFEIGINVEKVLLPTVCLGDILDATSPDD
ncbi:MAG: hypothetical protein JO228_09925 [Xanthobacteraceae bacterium]|nr:hypothetical protein [Xanthobacteraceae bacterium]